MSVLEIVWKNHSLLWAGFATPEKLAGSRRRDITELGHITSKLTLPVAQLLIIDPRQPIYSAKLSSSSASTAHESWIQTSSHLIKANNGKEAQITRPAQQWGNTNKEMSSFIIRYSSLQQPDQSSRCNSSLTVSGFCPALQFDHWTRPYCFEFIQMGCYDVVL